MTEAVETIEASPSAVTETLHTHLKIQQNHAYELITLESGFARVKLETKLTECIDDTDYVYEASLFSCANFAAAASVNERDTHLISAKIEFLNPIKVEDGEVLFEATAITNSSGKKQIDVVGIIKGIIVFEGSFVTLRLDQKSMLKKE